jgi:alkylation response protein AidB-like acyl-CoA dehydrogenase
VVPREYGGRGADPLTYAICLLEIARGCGATALTFNMHSNVLTFIDALGTPAQKRHYFGEVVERGPALRLHHQRAGVILPRQVRAPDGVPARRGRLSRERAQALLLAG